MATECRRPKRKKINENKLVKVYICGIFLSLVIIGGIIGFFIGRATVSTHKEIVTKTFTSKTPVYNTDTIPAIDEVFYYDIPLSKGLQQYIYDICSDKSVPITLVLAMIEHESRFNPEAVSPTDDYGLMQINEINLEWLGENYRCFDMLNPYQNVFCGVTIISQYINKYDGDYHKALMAYNMGDYGAKKAWQNGVTSTNYSTSILELMQKYEDADYDK